MTARSFFRSALPVCALAALAAGIFFYAPFFALREVKVSGETSMTAEKVQKSASDQLQKNLYRIDLGHLEKTLLKNPYLEKVQARRVFPWTLELTITQRKESAALPVEAGFAMISEKGVVLRIEQNLQAVNRPLVNGLELSTVKVGERLAIQDLKQFESIMEIIQECDNARLMDAVSEVDLKDLEKIRLLTNQGVLVELGPAENLHYKMKQLNQILLDLHRKGIRSGSVHMEHDGYPVYRKAAQP